MKMKGGPMSVHEKDGVKVSFDWKIEGRNATPTVWVNDGEPEELPKWIYDIVVRESGEAPHLYARHLHEFYGAVRS